MRTVVRACKTEDIMAAGEVLKQGGIVAFPTDTVYGLGAVFDDERAVRQIFAAKGREEKKPLSILVADSAQVELLSDIKSGEMAQKAARLMEKYWPGALTLIFEKKDSVEDFVTMGRKTIGIRVPDDDFILDLISRLGMPLMVTSANVSGEGSLLKWEDVLSCMDHRIDAIVCEDARGESASTIIDVTGEDIKVLRQGPILLEEIMEVLS